MNGVLVICQIINEVLTLREKLRAFRELDQSKIRLYTRDDLPEEYSTIERTMNAGDIILATNLAGRGTDIKMAKNVPLFVFLTFLPQSLSVQMQVKFIFLRFFLIYFFLFCNRCFSEILTLNLSGKLNYN